MTAEPQEHPKLTRYWRLRAQDAETALADRRAKEREAQEKTNREAAARVATRKEAQATADHRSSTTDSFERQKQAFIDRLSAAQESGAEDEDAIHIHIHPGATEPANSTVTQETTGTRDAIPVSVSQRQIQQVYGPKTGQEPWAAPYRVQGLQEGDIAGLKRVNRANQDRFKDEGFGYHHSQLTDQEREHADWSSTIGGYREDRSDQGLGEMTQSAAETIAAHRDQDNGGNPPRWTESEWAYYSGSGNRHEPGRYGETGETNRADQDRGQYFVSPEGYDPTPTRRSQPPRHDTANWVAENWGVAGEPVEEPPPLRYHGNVARSGPAPLVGNRPEAPNSGTATPNLGDPDAWTRQRGANPSSYDPPSAGVGRDQMGLRAINQMNRRKYRDRPLTGPLPAIQHPTGIAEVHDRRIYPVLPR